jgi:conjugal transfer ATP-binding protein TraC
LKLARALGGEFLEFSPESDICINPFELVQNYSEESEMLVGLVLAMAFPTGQPTDFQIGKLKEVMASSWVTMAHSMTIDDIADRLYHDEDQRAKDMSTQLFPFTSNGEYGRFFVGHNNVNFGNQLTVLELEELKGREHLQQVVLLQLIYQIQQTMYLGNRQTRKLCIVDESWDLLSKGNVSRFIETGYRRFRKYNGAAITVTQSVNDLYKNPAGVAIAENSANMILLGQKKETIESLKHERRISLGDAGFEILKSVRSVRGVFSELFLYMNGGQNVGVSRLIVDRYTQLLYSTHPDDINAIETRLSRGMNVDEAIMNVIDMEGED